MKNFVPNPAGPGGRQAVVLVTDRALRYRANRTPPPGPRVCHYCGSDCNVEVEHIDGHEENAAPANLTFACRSCNTLKGAYFARQGVGRRTRQYNPPGAGARDIGHWMSAVLALQGGGGNMEVGRAIRTVQATPHARRAEYAREIAAAKYVTLRAQNPEMGPHGPVFRQFYHDAAGAIARLEREQAGEALSAAFHPAVGHIDLIWGKAGKGGYGLAHILDGAKRAERRKILDRLQAILLQMVRVPHHSHDEAKLTDGQHVALVSLVWQPRGAKTATAKRWLLTAFYAPRLLNGEKPSAGRCLDVPGAHAAGRHAPRPGGSIPSMGKKPKRGNPPREPTYQQYLWAVKAHVRGAHDEGGKVIHATSPERRSEYAGRIAEWKRRSRRAWH